MQNQLFILGAGFNRDAEKVAGPIMGRSIYIGEYQIKCGYPLLNDLWDICFPSQRDNDESSIEILFQRSLEEKDFEPVRRMYNEIMKADYYLIPALLPDTDKLDSCYAMFFKSFPNASFLTFNYDSLPEVFLLHMGCWYPHDGYGVPVDAELGYYERDKSAKGDSSSLVLHLHGSLCIYTSEFQVTTDRGSSIGMISERQNPDFRFDPDAITNLFAPYTRGTFDAFGHEEIEERVIAPVPNKGDGLKKRFIQSVYSKAEGLLDESNSLVTIGYDFNPHDKVSYDSLLRRFSRQSNPKALLVSPTASSIKARLSKEYPSIEWTDLNIPFKEWVETGFLGLP